jgi:hypothetical protein
MPEEWSFMELKVPVTEPGQTDWVDVRIDRSDLGNGVTEKTVTVTGNPLQTLKLQPWLEEKVLINSPTGQDADPPTGHQSYSFGATPTATVTIHLQE